jgi:hypothetical protein
MFAGLITIAGGILAASGLIIARKPNAKELINKLTPYQGWIGLVLLFWGVWGVINCLMNLGMIAHFPLQFIFWLAANVADLGVGAILGFGLASKYLLSGNPAAKARGETLRAKLLPYQGVLGLFAIAMGVLYILWMHI